MDVPLLGWDSVGRTSPSLRPLFVTILVDWRPPRRRTALLISAATVLAVLLPASANGQRLRDAPAVVLNTAPIGQVGAHRVALGDTQQRPRGRLVVRTMTATIGLGVGTTLGAVSGGAAFDCNEDCVPLFALLGGAVGGVLGTAAGAAIPSFASQCTGAKRFWRGVGGAMLGGALGGLASWRIKHHTPLQIGTVVGGMSLGAALSQGPC